MKIDPGWQKNVEHRGKLITAIQNERVLWKAMTCCKNVWLSLKTNSAFKKAFKFQGKNAHSTVLQNAWSQKDQHFHWKSKFYHQKLIVFIEKRSWMTKKPRAPWKINYGHPKLKSPLKSNDLLQKRMTFFKNEFCF